MKLFSPLRIFITSFIVLTWLPLLTANDKPQPVRIDGTDFGQSLITEWGEICNKRIPGRFPENHVSLLQASNGTQKAFISFTEGKVDIYKTKVKFSEVQRTICKEKGLRFIELIIAKNDETNLLFIVNTEALERKPVQLFLKYCLSGGIAGQGVAKNHKLDLDPKTFKLTAITLLKALPNRPQLNINPKSYKLIKKSLNQPSGYKIVINNTGSDLLKLASFSSDLSDEYTIHWFKVFTKTGKVSGPKKLAGYSRGKKGFPAVIDISPGMGITLVLTHNGQTQPSPSGEISWKTNDPNYLELKIPISYSDQAK